MVDVICYGQRRTWNRRRDAIDFYWDGIMSCDGAERDRYVQIYQDLIAGKSVCSDGEPEKIN